MPSSHLILCHPLLLLPPLLPSIRVFSNESALSIRWPKYWSFSFNISPSNEHPGLISFRMDWLALLAVQGTLKSLLFFFFEPEFKSINSMSQWTSWFRTWMLQPETWWQSKPYHVCGCSKLTHNQTCAAKISRGIFGGEECFKMHLQVIPMVTTFSLNPFIFLVAGPIFSTAHDKVRSDHFCHEIIKVCDFFYYYKSKLTFFEQVNWRQGLPC